MQFHTATQHLAALKAGDLTSIELVDATIKRIETTDAAINSIVVRDFDRAREAARQADRARRAGEDRPLLGLPLTLKEAFDVEGLPTTWGLPGQHKPASSDAVVVERLRAAGAVILGKTNVATMLSDWQTANPVFGVTNNPWDRTRTPGGSSGGGAAAVAAGMIPLDFGSDLAGSLRIPAAFCGVHSHRPSYGLVPMRGFAPPMAPRTPIVQPIDQSTLGPIARSAEDLKLALEAIAGADAPDAAWRLALAPPRHTELKHFRALVLDTHPLSATSDSIRQALAKLANQLEREGCKVGRSADAIPDMKDLTRTFSALLMSLMGVDMPDDDYIAVADRARTQHGSDMREQSLTMSHRDWMLLDRHRLALAAAWRETFMRWDVVLCPAAPTTAFAHDHRPFDQRRLHVDGASVGYEQMSFWAALATPTGLPVTTAPIGFDEAGLPIGVQIIGPHLEDHTTLAFAHLLEHRLGRRFMAPVERQD